MNRDPASVYFAKPSRKAQCTFWTILLRGHLATGEPRLNFVTRGGEGAITARILPQDQVHPIQKSSRP